MGNARFNVAGIRRTRDAMADSLALLVLTVRCAAAPNHMRLRPLRVPSTGGGLSRQVRR